MSCTLYIKHNKSPNLYEASVGNDFSTLMITLEMWLDKYIAKTNLLKSVIYNKNLYDIINDYVDPIFVFEKKIEIVH
jgi:hypothetical protein